MKKNFNHRGFSLLEVMVTIGVLGVVTMGVMALFNLQINSYARINGIYLNDDFLTEMRGFVDLPGVCAANFENTPLDDTTPLDVAQLSNPADSSTVYQTNGLYQQSKIRLRAVQLRRDQQVVLDPGSGQKLIPLDLEIENLATPGSQTQTARLELYVEEDTSTNQLADCSLFSVEPESEAEVDTHWEKTADGNALYYTLLHKRLGIKISGDDFNNLYEVPGDKHVTTIGPGYDVAAVSFSNNPSHAPFYELSKYPLDTAGNRVLNNTTPIGNHRVGTIRVSTFDQGSGAGTSERVMAWMVNALGVHGPSETPPYNFSLRVYFPDNDEMPSTTGDHEARFTITPEGGFTVGRASDASTPVLRGNPFPKRTEATGNVVVMKALATGTVTNPSDIAFKRLDGVMQPDWEKFQAIEVASFKKNKEQRTMIGVIAQQVQKYYPELVQKNKENLFEIKDDGAATVLALHAVDLETQVLEVNKSINKKLASSLSEQHTFSFLKQQISAMEVIK